MYVISKEDLVACLKSDLTLEPIIFISFSKAMQAYLLVCFAGEQWQIEWKQR